MTWTLNDREKKYFNNLYVWKEKYLHLFVKKMLKMIINMVNHPKAIGCYLVY